MGVNLKNKNIEFARNLRRKSTETETYLWKYLKGRQIEGFKFRRQEPIGKYIVDFVNYEKKIIIELDGGQHLNNKKDVLRDSWFKKQNYKVLRF